MSLKTINVTRWKSYDTNEKHQIQIFEDDNIDDGITKIALSINNKSRFYVWNNNFPYLLFSIEDPKWKGFNNNPLKSSDRSNLIINQPIIYKYNYGICYFNKLNIIFEDDFPDLKDNHYYFIEKKFKNLDELKKREQKLINLSQIDLKTTENRTNLHRFELTAKISNYQSLADIYDKLNTNNFIQYIQWINDNFTLVHKLYMYHSINANILKSWTNTNKIADTDIRSINCYLPIKSSSNSYAKITINNNMTITIHFVLDLRKNMTLEDIEKYIYISNNEKSYSIQKYLESSLEQKINIKAVAIKVFNYISISNVSIDKLAKLISSYQDIFKSISYKKSINLIYKRCSNFTNETFDYSIYVRNRLILNSDISEIIEELISFNLTEEEANKIVLQEINLIEEMEQQNIKPDLTDQRLNTIVIIKTSKTGFDITIHNIPNKTELNYLTFWLSKIISSAQDVDVPKKKPVKIKIKTPSPSPVPSDNSQSDEIDYGKISYSSSGGALNKEDKENQRYKITLLQNTDKELFGENYARDKCQKRNQPLVISKENRQKLIDQNKYYVDNEVYYGSTKNNMNYYICPRLWCKVSKVPADPITGECPIPDEGKIESYFDNPNEIGVKRYVQIIKPNENDICAPCCFKKAPKESDLGKCKNYESYDPKNLEKNIIEEKDENYLINANAPIGRGRFGVVPKAILELLGFDTGKIDKNAPKVLARKGIIHKATSKENIIHTDSLIFALTYLLGFEKKNGNKSFMSDLENKLDLITYLSLENGNVCKAFMDKLPIIPNENEELIKELKKYFKLYPNISKLYNIKFSTSNNYQLSRFLAIFKSYKKFLNYLSSNDYSNLKSPYFIYAMICIIYNKLLIIWEKNGNDIQIICPYYTSYDDLIAIMEINPDIIMAVKDGKYYEPLELRYKNKDTNCVFKLNDFPKLKQLLTSCSINNKSYELNDKVYQNLYGLNNWIKTKVLFNNYNKFIINIILINNDLTIDHLITKGNILIKINKIGISFLPRLIKDLNISKIAFYDDYINKELFINVSVKDLDIFKEKVKFLDIKFDIGVIDKDKYKTLEVIEPVIDLNTRLIIKPKDLGNLDIIHSRIEDDLYFYDKNNEIENKKWFQLQMMVFNKLLKELNEEKLQKYQLLPRYEYINKIMENFTNNPDKNKIRIIIEEIPIYSIEHIKNYLNKMIIYYKYNFLDPNIKIDQKRKQFQFSQVAIKNGIIPDEIMRYHKSAPSNNLSEITYNHKDFNFNLDNTIIEEDVSKLPILMKEGFFEQLNSKWIAHKKSKWYLMEYLKVPNYKLDYFIEFFEWFSNLINIKATYESLIDISIKFLKDYKNNENIIKTLLKDKTLFKSFVIASGTKDSNVNIYWDKYYSVLNDKAKENLINKVRNNGKLLNDLIIFTMSQILNISILIIHRSVYGTMTAEKIRWGLEDLITSSTFIKAPNNHENRPLLIFYKIHDKFNITRYYLVFNKNLIPINSKSFYMRFDEIPQDIKLLLEEHMRLDKSKELVLLK